jgi:pyruvate dehydrogenase E1 component beta subunit
MAVKQLTQAITDAYSEEMARDQSVILFGEDVRIGLFGDTRGLVEQFGPARVRDTPICEAALTGMAVGAAMAGSRIICHLMFSNFLYTGFDAIANQAAKLRLMTGGQARLPVVFVSAYGGGTAAGAQHSDVPYPMFMNLGGINVVVPSTPADAKGLLKTAIRSDNPTCYFIPRTRGGTKGEIPPGDHLVPFGCAAVRRAGTDVTIVAIGTAMKHALAATEDLAAKGCSVELIDPRTLVPLDEQSILASLEKTGRLIIVDEARDRCSAASHISAVASEKGFRYLRGPVRRITTAPMPLPFAPEVERALLPSAARISAAALALLRG